jgi:hypothetical protein
MNFFLGVIHCTKFTNRRHYLETKFRESGVYPDFWSLEKDVNLNSCKSIEKNTLFGRSLPSAGFDLGISARSLSFSRRRAHFQGFVLFIRFLLSGNESLVMGSLPSRDKKLRAKDLELQRMHLNAIKSGIESSKEWILILEDDSRFDSKAFEIVNKVVHEYDCKKRIWMSLNSGAGLIKTTSDKDESYFGLYRVKPPAVRCSSGYLISNALAKQLLNLISKYGIPDWIPIDYVFHLALRKIGRVRSYWQDPPLFLQGSETGDYASGLR